MLSLWGYIFVSLDMTASQSVIQTRHFFTNRPPGSFCRSSFPGASEQGQKEPPSQTLSGICLVFLPHVGEERVTKLSVCAPRLRTRLGHKATDIDKQHANRVTRDLGHVSTTLQGPSDYP